VFDALRELMTPPDLPKRPIGFVRPADTANKMPGKRGQAKKSARISECLE